MKKLTALLALVLALSMLASCALAADPFGKYDEPVTVQFVRSTDDTLDANFFSQHPDKTMTDTFLISSGDFILCKWFSQTILLMNG